MSSTSPEAGLNIVVLAGGIGGARFTYGLRDAVPPDSRITVIGNTGDDIVLHGLHVSPDLDTLMYTLGDGIHPEQGWGRRDESFAVAGELAAHGEGPSWFTLGDKDFATHILRTRLLAQGMGLTEVTARLCERWQPGVRLLPMSDDPVQTHVVVTDPETGDEKTIHFQEWWVRRHAAWPAHRFDFQGLADARPAPGVLEAVAEADVILLPPSNPVVSVGPILAVAGVREAVRDAAAPVVGVSPIVDGAPVRGMADACLTAIGVQTSAAAVAGLYADLLDGWLVAPADAAAAESLGDTRTVVRARPLLMTDRAATADLARAALELAEQVRGRG